MGKDLIIKKLLKYTCKKQQESVQEKFKDLSAEFKGKIAEEKYICKN